MVTKCYHLSHVLPHISCTSSADRVVTIVKLRCTGPWCVSFKAVEGVRHRPTDDFKVHLESL